MNMRKIFTISTIVLIIAMLSACQGEGRETSFTGLVEGRVYSVSSPVSERLLELHVEEGSLVEMGAPVGRIDTAALALQRKSLKAKRDQIVLQLDELALNTAQVKDTRDYYAAAYRRNLELLKEQAVSDQTVRDL